MSREESQTNEEVTTGPNREENNGNESSTQKTSRFDRFVLFASHIIIFKPLICFFSCIILILIVVILVIVTGNMNLSQESDYDWLVTNEDYTIYFDMLIDLRDRSALIESQFKTREAPLNDLTMSVIYQRTKNSNIFTALNLQRMCLIETQWFDHPKYRDYCPLDYS